MLHQRGETSGALWCDEGVYCLAKGVLHQRGETSGALWCDEGVYCLAKDVLHQRGETSGALWCDERVYCLGEAKLLEHFGVMKGFTVWERRNFWSTLV